MISEKDRKLMWKTLSSRYVSRDPWFTVREETMELPTGKIIPEYHVLEYPEWINVIALTKDKKIIMERQYRHGLGRVSYETPAGVCEKKDPSLLESAKRELLEETGYGNGSWQFFTALSANPSTHSNLAHTFLATDVEKIADQSLDEGEALEVHLLEPDEVLELLQKGEIVQSLMAAPLWKYFYTFKAK